MPLLDLTFSDGALDADAEQQLLRTCMDLLLRYEGAEPSDQRRYRIVVTVPEGMLDPVAPLP